MAKVTVFKKVGSIDLQKLDESTFETIISFIIDQIGNNWSVEFREYCDIFELKIYDAYIEAGTPAEYKIIQDAISTRLPREFMMSGRYAEYIDVKNEFIFHWGTIHFVYPYLNFLPESFLADLPRELVYAAIFS